MLIPTLGREDDGFPVRGPLRVFFTCRIIRDSNEPVPFTFHAHDPEIHLSITIRNERDAFTIW